MLLGNAVCPDVARRAFRLLWSGFREPEPGAGDLRALEPEAAGLAVWEGRENFPSWGHASPQGGAGPSTRRLASRAPPLVLRLLAPPRPLRLAPIALVLDPASFDCGGRRQEPALHERSPYVTSPQTLVSWATPRSVTNAARELTVRMMRDLPTQVRVRGGGAVYSSLFIL